MRTVILHSDCIRILDPHRKDMDLVKVITGLHGYGKSELIRQFIEHLRNDGAPGSEIINIDLKAERSGYGRVLLTMDRDENDVPEEVELINVVDWPLTVP